ncbi:protein kinase domain-containing protein [Thermogemmatispora sp.]|uniref:protein kinase domain-containing protein n=1 Tax=Thermogemmatispora sp. TaxID=1968838 RepID=UPI001D457662|nr:protein kinase [Thermogemmatispora sp.]MBX5451135.1 protein kinase [Thermogemmatispora sp.]
MDGDMIGRVIKGRYKLIDERGRGNFATVYVARDLENNHIYAIKVLHVELAGDSELLARFQREARILLHLSDPHIVRIIDYGEDHSLHFIVMDYIDGQNLKYHTITYGPLKPSRALNYAHQIVEGLDVAYRHGVVHRDIKPQNILINTKDVVKITDFGLARSSETVTLTRSNMFMGTPYYIAPEQAESGRAADTRSDLYSVATVLFEMLTGHPPFEGETAVDIVIKHMNEKVPSICRQRPGLPPEMDQFFQKAMAKSPADRFQTPQEFLAALEQLQQRVHEVGADERAELPEGERPAPPRMPPQKQARLVVIATGQVFPLTGEQMVVGRHDPILGIYPEINLMDKTVGRRHAYIRNQHGTFTVEDLNALNKTRLNGVVLAPHEEHVLKDGDILRFGSVEVRFELR